MQFESPADVTVTAMALRLAADVTQIYAERDLAKGAEIARQIG